jgi:prevent-host-death family protein
MVTRLPPPTLSPPALMYTTRGIEAIATITELRSKTSELIEESKKIKTGILIQKNNDPHAVLVSYDRYLQLLDAEKKASKK